MDAEQLLLQKFLYTRDQEITSWARIVFSWAVFLIYILENEIRVNSLKGLLIIVCSSMPVLTVLTAAEMGKTYALKKSASTASTYRNFNILMALVGFAFVVGTICLEAPAAISACLLVLWLISLASYARLNQALSNYCRPAAPASRKTLVPFADVVEVRSVLRALSIFISLIQFALLCVCFDVPHYVFHTAEATGIWWEGIGKTLLFSPLGFLLLYTVFFIRPHRNPSAWQRLQQKWLVLCLAGGCLALRKPYNSDKQRHFVHLQLRLFQWSLAHPGETYPPEMVEEIRNADLARKESFCPEQTPLIIGYEAARAPRRPTLSPTPTITPFLKAVMDNNLQKAQELLPSWEIHRPYAPNGNTPLHIAVWNGYTDMVKLLLAQPDIDKNIQNLAGKTPLDLAEEKHFEEIICLLKS